MGESDHPDPVPPATYGPLPRGERLVGIDFVRGIALLGILFVNSISFFGPMIAESRPSAFENPKWSTLDCAARLAVGAFCTTKFISLFSMLFAYGLLTQFDRVQASGHSVGLFATRRLLVLGLIGLAHGLGLWYGDILLNYAIFGFFVVVLRRVTQPRDLVILLVVFLGSFALLRMAGEFLNLFLDSMPGHPAMRRVQDVRGLRGLSSIIASGGNPYSPIWADGEKAAYAQGPYSDLFLFRLTQWLMVQSSMWMGSWYLVVGNFFVGMWLYRVRFFAPEQAALRRKTLLVCLPIGLAIEGTAAGLYALGLAQEAPLLWAMGGVVQALALPLLPLGYLAGLTMLANAVPRWLTSPIVCAGRMPLTVYLGETVIATTLAYYYGYGWFGKVSPAQEVGLSLAIWAALVVYCRLWLTVFRLGPMEWLWRLLEYGRTRSC